jgi:hypothetical protein
MRKIKYFIFFLSLLFLGCSYKTTPVYAVVKTPFFKASDAGFLENGVNYKKLIIYKEGHIPIKIIIYKNSICLNENCFPKNEFIKKLSFDYSKNLLDSIIEKKPLKNLGKITKLKNGFLQKNNRFFYLITKNKVLFKDKLKKIVIMIKEIN